MFKTRFFCTVKDLSQLVSYMCLKCFCNHFHVLFLVDTLYHFIEFSFSINDKSYVIFYSQKYDFLTVAFYLRKMF